MSTVPNGVDEDRLVGALAVAVVGSGAIVYYVDLLALWIAWWLGTVTLVGAALVLTNRGTAAESVDP